MSGSEMRCARSRRGSEISPWIVLPSSTRWRRPIGCLESQVIYRKRAANHMALSRKMTYKDEASSDSMPPCSSFPDSRVADTNMGSCR